MSDLNGIVRNLTVGTDLADWTIRIKFDVVPEADPANPTCSARVDFDEGLRSALIHVCHDYADRDFCTLEQIVAHELGHLLLGEQLDDMGDRIPEAKACVEVLASRIGRLLLQRCPRP